MFYGAAIVNDASAEFRHKICKAEQTPNYESFREQALNVQRPTSNKRNNNQ